MFVILILFFGVCSVASMESEKEQLRYILWTNRTNRIEFDLNDETTLGPLIPQVPFTLLVDGFTSTDKTEMQMSIKDAIFQKYGNGNTMPHNVAVLDWSAFNGQRLVDLEKMDTIVTAYALASMQICHVGHKIANSICKAQKLKSFQRIHIISHSLGVPLAGYISRTFKEICGGLQISRVTGLDPSGPLFNLCPSCQLRKGDGAYVEIIHTNAGGMGVFGEVSGDVNLFLNGAVTQPGCKNENGTQNNIFGGNLPTIGNLMCHHSYSHRFYTATIVGTKTFTGCPCKETINCKSTTNTNCANPLPVGYHSSNMTIGRLAVFAGELN